MYSFIEDTADEAEDEAMPGVPATAAWAEGAQEAPSQLSAYIERLEGDVSALLEGQRLLKDQARQLLEGQRLLKDQARELLEGQRLLKDQTRELLEGQRGIKGVLLRIQACLSQHSPSPSHGGHSPPTPPALALVPPTFNDQDQPAT